MSQLLHSFLFHVECVELVTIPYVNCVSCHFQAVYLKHRGGFGVSSKVHSKALDATSSFNPLDSTEDKSNLLVVNTEDPEDGDDKDNSSDLAEGLSGLQSILRDMIPGVKVRVFKVTAPGKVDTDLIAKVIEQIIEEEDQEKPIDLESIEAENEMEEESDEETDEIEMDDDPGFESEEQDEIAVEVVVGGLGQKLSNNLPNKDLLRVPAKLVNKGRLSFSFSIDKSINEQDSGGKKRASLDKLAKRRSQRSIDDVMFDLAKFFGREKIPLKVGWKFFLGIPLCAFGKVQTT